MVNMANRWQTSLGMTFAIYVDGCFEIALRDTSSTFVPRSDHRRLTIRLVILPIAHSLILQILSLVAGIDVDETIPLVYGGQDNQYEADQYRQPLL